MIQIVTGKTGEGKTKQMITLAHDHISNAKGEIVYIDSTSHHRFDLSYRIRLIEANTFPLTPHDFFGFLCGILASNHDIEYVFIDEVIQLTRFGTDELISLIEKIKLLSEQYHVHFVIGVSFSKKDIPLHFLDYLVA